MSDVLGPTIVGIVRALQRDYGRVYPWMVQAQLPVSCAEVTVRRYMRHLAQRGELVRVGDFSRRLGYRA